MIAITADQLRTMTDYEIRRVLGIDPMGPKPWAIQLDTLRDHEDTSIALDAAIYAERGEDVA